MSYNAMMKKGKESKQISIVTRFNWSQTHEERTVTVEETSGCSLQLRILLSLSLSLLSLSLVTEELIQGFQYKIASGGVNFIISVDYEDVNGQVRHLGQLQHFLRIPHPEDDPDKSTS
jgi:hypothetical protein